MTRTLDAMAENAPKKRKFSDLENGKEVEWVKDELKEMKYPDEIVTQVTASLVGVTSVTLREASMEDLNWLLTKTGTLENPMMAPGIAQALHKRMHPKQLPPATGHDHRTL